MLPKARSSTNNKACRLRRRLQSCRGVDQRLASLTRDGAFKESGGIKERKHEQGGLESWPPFSAHKLDECYLCMASPYPIIRIEHLSFRALSSRRLRSSFSYPNQLRNKNFTEINHATYHDTCWFMISKNMDTFQYQVCYATPTSFRRA